MKISVHCAGFERLNQSAKKSNLDSRALTIYRNETQLVAMRLSKRGALEGRPICRRVVVVVVRMLSKLDKFRCPRDARHRSNV